MNTLRLTDATMLELRALLTNCVSEPHFELLVKLHESGMPFDTFSVSETLVNAIRVNSKHINHDILDRLIDAGMPLKSDNQSDNSSLADILVSGPSDFSIEVLQSMFDRLLSKGDTFMDAPHFDGNRLHRIINYPGSWYVTPSGVIALSVILNSSILSPEDKVSLLVQTNSVGDTPIESLLRKRLISSADFSNESLELLYMAGSPSPSFENIIHTSTNAEKIAQFKDYFLELSSKRASALMRHGIGMESQARARFRL